MNNNYLETLFLKLQEKKNEDIKKSYTAKLLNDPKLLAKKIGEESVEVLIEILNQDKKRLISESADLFYHILVSWIHLNIKPQDVWKELEKRAVLSNLNQNKRNNNEI